MYSGGTSYTPEAARIMRWAGLLTPLLAVTYGFLFTTQLLHAYALTPYSPLILSILAVCWMLLAIWQFIFPPRTKSVAATRLILYHVMAAIYLLLVTGVASPFSACWILLLIAVSLYISRTALLWSIISFVLIVAIDITLWMPTDATIAIYDLGVLVAILLCGIVVMNITKAQEVDRQELRRSHEQESLQRDRMLTIVNNLADAIIGTDQDGIVRVYNAASLDLLDTNDSLNGHHIDEVIRVSDQSGDSFALGDSLKNVRAVTVRDDLWYSFEDGEKIRLEMTISPIRNTFNRSRHHAKSGDGYIIIMRDVTKAKSLEEERDEFISVVSHELRTPITVVEGSLSNVELMLSRPNVDTSMLASAVSLAHEQTIFLAKMINDLSTLSRAERGVADEKETIQVNELVTTLYANYSPSATEKGLHLNLDAKPQLGSVVVSRLYLEELLQNFLTNAIKYTKSGNITLSVSRKHDTITFSVKDTGIGISKSEQAKIFEKFYRSEDYRTRETGGTGLGLYVAMKLARKIGTEIQLVSRLNHGSTFSFSLPAEDKTGS